MDLFVAYKLHKRIVEELEEERKRRKSEGINEINKKEQKKETNTMNKNFPNNNCFNCGQNQIWCVCNYSAMD